MKKYFVVVDQYSDDYSETAVAVDWDKFPDDLVESLGGVFMKDVWAVDEKGNLFEKTVLFIDPVDELSEDEAYLWEIGDNIVVGMYDF
jgi:hypothetical protein